MDLSATSVMDYGAFTPATVTFAANVDTQTVSLAITDDTSEEHIEQFIVQIGFVNAATAAANRQALLEPLHKATVTIDDDDSPSKLFLLYLFQSRVSLSTFRIPQRSTEKVICAIQLKIFICIIIYL